VLEEPFQIPILRVLSNGAGADERGALDGPSDLLRNLDDGIDVRFESTSRAIGRDGEFLVDDLLRQPQDLFLNMGARAGQTYVDGMNPEIVHEVKDLELLLDGRRGDGRTLEAVPERFVVEFDGFGWIEETCVRQVPVVDEIPVFHRVPP
jgi:hypothetical protein